MTKEWDEPTPAETRPLRSYGRRKGKRLSPRKERLLADLLPQLSPDIDHAAPEDLRALFPVPVREVWLEIGFGSGEHLAWQAEQNPDIGIIGCEPFINGVAALLGAVEDRGLKTVSVHDGDARDVLAWLPGRSIARAFILFPDPWPKARQMKRRLVSPEFVSALARVMRSGAELRFASDDSDYAAHALLTVKQSGAFAWLARKAGDWRIRPDDWPETRYERKALSGGEPVYLSWQRL
ncbi:MAG TPA: tRNA (guanine(46)-N(7))-methyltransferase TrmB [Methyloceanibacter sp.]|nr:tRNA (guanine(46)-N(7))-methyltransferase TrmB [Methyloceanibacter sp.]